MALGDGGFRPSREGPPPRARRSAPNERVEVDHGGLDTQLAASHIVAAAACPTKGLLTNRAPEFIGNIVEGSPSGEPNLMRPSIPAPVLQRHAKIEGTPIPEHQGPFKDISKLSHISRPMVLRQGFDCDAIEHRQV